MNVSSNGGKMKHEILIDTHSGVREKWNYQHESSKIFIVFYWCMIGAILRDFLMDLVWGSTLAAFDAK